MIFVGGFFGSGNKWLARGLAVALTGNEKFEDEPFPAGAYRRWCKTRDSGDWGTVEAFFGQLHTRTWPVAKDHFLVDYWMRRIADTCPGVRAVYLQRRTLGNVQYLLQWPALEGWMWYHEEVLAQYPEDTLAIWPEAIPLDYVPAKLAVAHAIRTHYDRQMAHKTGALVVCGECLFSEYSVAWPSLFLRLEVEPRREWDGWVGTNRIPPFYPIETDKGMLRAVLETEERAAHHFKEEVPCAEVCEVSP